MAKRAKPYIIQSHLGDHEMPAREWHEYARMGYLKVIRDRIARPARNVVVWFEGTKLRLLHAFYIYTSWLAIDRIAPKREIEPDEFDKIHCGLRIQRYSLITQVTLSGIPANSQPCALPTQEVC